MSLSGASDLLPDPKLDTLREPALELGERSLLERRLSGLRLERTALAGWLERFGEETPQEAEGGFVGTLNSGWILRRRDVPQLHAVLRWTPETGLLELRGAGVWFGERGLGVNLERGDQERETRLSLSLRRSF